MKSTFTINPATMENSYTEDMLIKSMCSNYQSVKSECSIGLDACHYALFQLFQIYCLTFQTVLTRGCSSGFGSE